MTQDIRATLERLIDLADGFNVSGVYFNERPENEKALKDAEAALSTDTLDQRTIEAAAKVCDAIDIPDATVNSNDYLAGHVVGCIDCAKALRALAQTAEQPEAGAGWPDRLKMIAKELLVCCEAWEPDVCVMGNVRAKDAAEVLRDYIAHPHNAGEQGEAILAELIEQEMRSIAPNMERVNLETPLDLVPAFANALCRGEQQAVPEGWKAEVTSIKYLPGELTVRAIDQGEVPQSFEAGDVVTITKAAAPQAKEESK